MKKQILSSMLFLFIGIMIGISGMYIYNSTKKSKTEAKTEEKQSEQDDKKTDSMTDYETQDSFRLTEDCHPSIPENMAVYYTESQKYVSCKKMVDMFSLEGMDAEIKKTNTVNKDKNNSEYPIELWKSDWIDEERLVTINRSKDYFNYILESKVNGYLDSTSGAISGIDANEYKNIDETKNKQIVNDYYSEKGFNVLNGKFFSLSDYVEGAEEFDEKQKEEYAVRTYVRIEKKLPVLGAYYYKNNEGVQVYGDTIALHLNSRGVIAMTLAHIRNITEKKEDLDSTKLITVETASDAILEYLENDKDITRRLSTSDVYAIWYPVREENNILYKPAWYFKTAGTGYYKDSQLDKIVSEQINNSFCVDMCTGEVFELYSSEY